MIPIQPVILCGGSGTRLWPMSRAGFNRQFPCLTGDESLFQLAAKCLMGLGASVIDVANFYIVSGEGHRFLPAGQLRESGIEHGAAQLEPIGHNTAPALADKILCLTRAGSRNALATDGPLSRKVGGTQHQESSAYGTSIEIAAGIVKGHFPKRAFRALIDWLG